MTEMIGACDNHGRYDDYKILGVLSPPHDRQGARALYYILSRWARFFCAIIFFVPGFSAPVGVRGTPFAGILVADSH